jgi:hypothetical protein
MQTSEGASSETVQISRIGLEMTATISLDVEMYEYTYKQRWFRLPTNYGSTFIIAPRFWRNGSNVSESLGGIRLDTSAGGKHGGPASGFLGEFELILRDFHKKKSRQAIQWAGV